MYSKIFVAAILASAASSVAASPNPVPVPEPVPTAAPEVEARQNPGDVFNSLTSAAANVVTSDVPSLFSQATSNGASVLTQVTSVAGSVGSQVTSAVGGVGGSIVTQVTSAAGHAFTVITSEGGQALTLAESGAITSVFGSVYTVATAAVLPSGSNNAALGMQTAAVASPAIVGLVTVLGSALLGAVITL
ncbi:hypothetical protein NP233_g1989 [Leucocoprinus birnbaumii]|uniref:Uncharacterized protein n=1 Tax=Leucocoprinus birnbaumii TaxID=56174 RepID=A0AAD5YU84_9AGAR|nr:hypothetical protein NP233_g1989 [Leucocoprinus birnbaumii]